MENKPSQNWYVRASSMGALMSRGRTKGELFGATAREIISDAIRFNRDGTEKDLSVKYLSKGIQNESEALEMFLNNKGVKFEKDDDGFVVTNKLRRFNDYVTGEPDWCDENILADVKCSWSASSFPDVLKKPSNDLKKINKDYWFQMQCYMWLFDRQTSFLAYCLTDTPDDLFEKEVYYKTLQKNGEPDSLNKSMEEVEDEVRDKLTKSHKFSQVKNRIRIFQIDRDEEAIEEMKQRVNEARLVYDDFYNRI
jgi:hypothetical protein